LAIVVVVAAGVAAETWTISDQKGRRPSESWGRYRFVPAMKRQDDSSPSFRWGDDL